MGVSLNEEQSIESTQYAGNLDGLFSVQFKKYFYSYPKHSINADYTMYAGLSGWGRTRMELNVNWSFEMIKDFTIGLGFNDNYDNRPLKGSDSKNDLLLRLWLGFAFGN